MADNEEYTEEDSTNEFVTKSELREMLQEILGGGTGSDETGDDDEDGWEIVEDFKDAIESLTSSDVERIAEQKVQDAIKKLTDMKATSASTKKKAAPKKVAPEPEVEPTVKKRGGLSAFLWGTEE